MPRRTPNLAAANFVMRAASVLIAMGVALAPTATGTAFAQTETRQTATGPSATSQDATTAPKATAAPSSLQTQLGRAEARSVEDHIATLHARLRISPAQEKPWQKLADAMRASVVQLDRVYAERQKQDGARSAIDDLRSYGRVQQTRADNVRNLIAPLAELYAGFDAEQKKAADQTFRKFTEGAVKGTRY